MFATAPVKSVMLIAIASVLATGIELAGIDHLATPRAAEDRQMVAELPRVVVTPSQEVLASADVVELPRVVVTPSQEVLARADVVELPRVVVTPQREAVARAEVRQLPRVVVYAHRETQTAQALPKAAAI